MLIEQKFITDIKSLLETARQTAYTAVNSVLWRHVGKRIVEEEQSGNARADYGSFLIEELSKQLSGEFVKGFSEANLRNFRQFYLTYPDQLNSLHSV